MQKIDIGLERNDIGKLSWGGADLIDILDNMNNQRELWTGEQVEEIENLIIKVRNQIERGFNQWLSRLSVDSIEHLSQFRHINLQIASSLQKLNLPEEHKLLENHVEQVTKNIQLITKINNVVSDINSMVRKNKVTEITPVLVLNSWIEQAEEFEQSLNG